MVIGMSMQKKEQSNRNGFLENAVYVIAFFVPIFIMILIYLIRGIYPFGEQMYLRSDMYHQYAPFYQELANKLKEGGSLTYTWNVGMGMNFTALAAYYLASPINVILGLFTGEHIIEVMSSLIIFKMGLSSLTATWYLTKHFEKKNITMAVFGIFYATSSYFCAFSWNIMWLDCMVLLPLIVLGIEKIIKEGRYKLYCISLGVAIFSNYYIAIMLCIFSLIYFVYGCIAYEGEKGVRFFVNRSMIFGVCSLLAGGMAACLILPEYNALMLTASGEFNFPETWQNYFSIMDMMSRSLMNVKVAIFEPHDPNLYCSVIIFLLVPMYWLCRQVPLRERVGKTVILAIFLISFNMNIPNYIWHGFHFPNSLPCRESFIYIFIILTMAYEALHYVKEFSNKQIFGSFGGAVFLFLILEEMYVSDTYEFSIIYVSLAFLALYLLVVCLYRNAQARRGLVVYLLFIVTITESIINANETGFSSTSRTYYIEDNAAIEELRDEAEQDAAGETLFYRMEKYERRTKNDAAWHQYRGMSTFSSTAVKGIGDLYKTLGLQQSYNAYAFYGATPLTASLFSVKYVLSNELREDYATEELLAEEKVNETKSVYLYKNTYTLPIGFMTDGNSLRDWEKEQGNPFAVQNAFAEHITGISNLFTSLEVVDNNGDQRIFAEKDSDVYFYVYTPNAEKVIASVYDKDGSYVRGETFENTNHKYICHAGNVEKGCYIDLYGEDEDGESVNIQVYAYRFNSNKMKKVYESLEAGGLELTTFEDALLEGTVTAKQDGMMYTSISYETGWKVYVDGEQVQTESIRDALLAFPVSAGTHTVRMEYEPEGLRAGLVLSIISILIFILIVVGEFVWKRKKAAEKDREQTKDRLPETEVAEAHSEEWKAVDIPEVDDADEEAEDLQNLDAILEEELWLEEGEENRNDE